MKKQILIPAITLLALSSSIATFATQGAFAQAANAPAAAPDQGPHHDFAARLERHIDHVKSALKITPTQEPLFNSWAQAMRDNAAEMQKSVDNLRTTRDQHHTAIDWLQTDVQLTQLRAGQEQRLLDAFKPLYASLSADQQKDADKLMAPRHFGHHRA